MITIALTYRNRDLNIVKKCLNSLKNQSDYNFKVILVNYGSLPEYSLPLENLVKNYPFIKLINCPTQGQLWNKSRAINMALKQCKTPFFLVSDIDLIHHPDFIKIANKMASEDVFYFKYSFLSKKESSKDNAFNAYSIDFFGGKEITGTTLFSTNKLKAVNGYDEFYHGWGAEDTDIHVRLKASGIAINFYDKKILIKHQWHPKHYRKKNDLTPFHSHLERINHAYLNLTEKTKKTKANLRFDWGVCDEKDYKALKKIDSSFEISNKESEVKGFINNVLLECKSQVVRITIKQHQDYKSIKQNMKFLLGKKTILFLDMQTINNMLLECIVMNFRNHPYQYHFNQNKKTIVLTIKL